MVASALISLTVITRPSTTPALKLNSGLSFAYFASAFASATGSPSVYAIEVTPWRFFSASSTFVPLPARSAKVFFTTRYFAPVGRNALRNSKSCVTVSLEYVATIMLEAFFSSPPSFSTCATFLALVTAIVQTLSGNLRAAPGTGEDARRSTRLRLGCNLDRSRIQRDSRPHARTQIASLDVLALGHRRLCLNHARNQRCRVVDQFVGRKRNLSHRHMHQSRLVGAELDLAGFDFLHRTRDVHGDRTRLWIWHQTLRSKHLAQT